MKLPYISFVIASRNDDYAGSMLLRQQTSLEIFIEQLERYELDSEIIVVDWNPPPERVPLKSALRIPTSSNVVAVRFVEVPPEIHLRYKHCDKKPMHGAVAFNVGMRRAVGRFILPRVADAFYSDALVKLLSEKALDPNRIYRCDRLDVDPVILEKAGAGTAELLAACERNVVKHYAPRNEEMPFGLPSLHREACGDFLLMAKEQWHAIRAFEETPDVFSLDVDRLALYAAHLMGIKQCLLPDDCRVYKIGHARMCIWNQKAWENPLVRLGGQALRGLGVSPETRARLRWLFNVPKRRRGELGAPLRSQARGFEIRAIKWAKGVGPFYVNGPDWGLSAVNLPTHTMCRAEWDL